MSSLRKQGPITTGFRRCAKAVGQHLSKHPPRRMGPCFRRDDELPRQNPQHCRSPDGAKRNPGQCHKGLSRPRIALRSIRATVLGSVSSRGDRVQRLVLGIFGFACLVGGIVSTGLMLYYFLFMLGSGKPEKKQYSRFLGPLVFFFPQLWDEEGNRARVRTLVFALLFAACFGALALVHNLSIQLR